MTFYLRRRAQEDIARREAAGENVWSQEFKAPTRVRLWSVAAAASEVISDRHPRSVELTHYVVRVFAAQLGRELVLRGPADLYNFWKAADEAEFATLLEITVNWCVAVEGTDIQVTDLYNSILAETRTAWEFIGEEIVPFESRELHQEVVVPTLLLLGGLEGWEGVEATYRKALHEIGADPSDAITDAGTALQEALVLLGARGNQLGDLLRSARKLGLLAAHDAPLSDAIEKIGKWVAADRSSFGDAHNSVPALREDAWFCVHVTGALILRLAGPPRSQPAPS